MELTVDFLDELCRKTAHVLEGQKDVTDEQIKDTAYKVYKAAAPEHYITVDERLYVSNYVFNNMRKLGPLQTILDDHTITEVMINGPDTIFIEKNGRLQKADVHFNSARQLEDIIQRIVATVNRTVDMANPICDARLEDGSRVNIVLPPVALNGPIVTIRKFPDKVIQFDDLIRWNSVTPEAAAFLKSAVEAKYNIFVSGGTGSGKTTFLNALSNFIPKDERIITIEDSAELQIKTIPQPCPAGDPQRQRRGQGRGDDPRSDSLVAAYAPGAHRRRRGARRGGAGHAAGHEHRPRRLAVHRPRQLPAGYVVASGNDGADGFVLPHRGNPPTNRLGGGYYRASGALE